MLGDVGGFVLPSALMPRDIPVGFDEEKFRKHAVLTRLDSVFEWIQ